MKKPRSSLYPWLFLVILAFVVSGSFYFKLYSYCSMESLSTHHQALSQWTKTHYGLAVLIYLGLYIGAAATAMPGTTILLIAGGFLFGNLLGTLYAVCSATIGAGILVFMIQASLLQWFQKYKAAALQMVEKKFQKNAFYYLLTLRLIPITPFWLVNIFSGLLKVRLATFLAATFLGIIPGTLIYTTIGSSLTTVFTRS
jgi:uncharacterized membrane protein YdjX (TVP38/TMEM64 family)